MISHSTEKLALLTSVAEAFAQTGQLAEFDIIELEVNWVTLDFGDTMLPDVKLKMQRKDLAGRTTANT